jgi:hypothetical protein
MRLVPGLAVLATAVMAITGCATTGVSSYRVMDIDFTSYHTFDWGPADALPTGDPRLDKNPYFQDRLQGAVERELALRKLERPERGATPELLIHYHANVSRRLDVNRVDYSYGLTVDAESQIRDYEAGTIVLDLVDARTNQVIWRGWAQRDMTELLEDEGKMAGWIETAVRLMLAQLPPTF